MSATKRHSVWVVLIAWTPSGTIESSSRRLVADDLDETAANMLTMGIGNMSKQEEFAQPLRDDYEPVSIWETQAGDI